MSILSENVAYHAIFTLVYTRKKIFGTNLAKMAIYINWPPA